MARENWSAIGVIVASIDRQVHTGRRGAPSPPHVGTAVVAGATVGNDSEIVWRLVIRGEALPGAYLLREGGFIELGDAAEWRGWGGTGNAIEAAHQGWRWGRPLNDPTLTETY